jgi:hypothetical protein
MFKLSETELAALNPLIRRIGLSAIAVIAAGGFLIVGVAVHTLTGSLAAAGAVVAAEVAGAVILLGATCAWAALEESSNRAAREVSTSNAPRASKGAPARKVAVARATHAA